MKTAIASFCVVCAACGARDASDEIKAALATPKPEPTVAAKVEEQEPEASSDRQEAVKEEKVKPPEPTPTPKPEPTVVVVIQPSPAPTYTPEQIAARRQAHYVECFRNKLPECLETFDANAARRCADDTCRIWRECSVEKLFSSFAWPL